ncbi:MAG: DUF2748 family protein [Alphaproteobacteria bacterium]
MSNLYHILYKIPALEKYEMVKDLEKLAEKLVKSGKLRIDGFDKVNYVRFTIPHKNLTLMFSKRELTDPKLMIETQKILLSLYKNYYRGKELSNRVNVEIKRLRNEIKKYQPISFELEMKLARLIVQSAHPVIILLILIEKVEVFISYSYNIGDMLDIVSWQHSGENSGMQSTNGKDVAIFTSAGGDPFGKTEKDATFGDGFPALSRMMVIAAQEIGHYSDILRDRWGRQISRHSANFGGTRAKENVRIARIKDMANIDKINFTLRKIGLDTLYEYERHIKFFKKNKRYGLIYIFTQLKIYIYKKIFFLRANKLEFKFLIKEKKEKYFASKLVALFLDMKFNLAPVADVYKSDDKDEEEAIACIEALARVPQQVLKWGRHLTQELTPNLFDIYYSQVIPSCIETYENITNQKYYINFKSKEKAFWYIFLKKLFRKKHKFYKAWEY